MRCRHVAGWLGLCVVWLAATPAKAQVPGDPRPATTNSAAFPATRVPLEQLPAEVREPLRKVLERPTLSARGPAETFHCRPSLYQWIVDHPDQAVCLWRRLGAQCPDIRCEGPGRFTWHDPQAGDLHWQTVLNTPQQRIWYAEGKVRPAPLLPASMVRAVVVLHVANSPDSDGRATVRHQIDLVLHTDSRALAFAARLFGASAPRLAESYIGQMEMFFGALAWYLSDNPQRAQALFQQLRDTGPGQSPSTGTDG
jgi:hypothetical protein